MKEIIRRKKPKDIIISIESKLATPLDRVLRSSLLFLMTKGPIGPISWNIWTQRDGLQKGTTKVALAQENLRERNKFRYIRIKTDT